MRTRSPLLGRRGAPLRSDGFEHVADIMVGSFYDPELEEGAHSSDLVPRRDRRAADACVRPAPFAARAPGEPLVGAAAVHELLKGWRRRLANGPGLPAAAAAPHQESTAPRARSSN